MESIGPRITGVEHGVQDIKEAVARMVENQSGNQNVSSITLYAGGVGVWIAATACFVMLASMIVGALWMSRELTRIDVALSERKEENDRMQTYLSAIYAQAPHLKAKEDEVGGQESK